MPAGMDEELLDFGENEAWDYSSIFRSNKENQEVLRYTKDYSAEVQQESFGPSVDTDKTLGLARKGWCSLSLQTNHMTAHKSQGLSSHVLTPEDSLTKAHNGKGAKFRRLQKCAKARTEKVTLVFRLDIGMNSVEVFSAQALVGHFMKRVVSKSPLSKWMETEWRDLMGYLSHFHLLLKGWLCFEFISDEDLELI
jgi:hypothetical protein